VQTLSYASASGLVNDFRWRRFLWRHRIFACLIASLASCPACAAWLLNHTPAADVFGRFAWQTVIAVAIAAQLVALTLWLLVAIGLLYDDRPLTDAEEVAMPLIPMLLSAWMLLDMVAGILWSILS